MAKHRTKKQKMKAAEKRGISIGEHGYSFSETTTPTVRTKPSISHIQTQSSEKDHSYVLTEVRQTVLIVTGIIVAQLVLAALIRTNVLNIPFYSSPV